jgi:apolipoprotein N-acyltransferase
MKTTKVQHKGETLSRFASGAMSTRNIVNVASILLFGAALGTCWFDIPDKSTSTLAWSLWTVIILLCTVNSPHSSGWRWFIAGMAVRGTAFHWVPGVVAENFDIAWSLALLFFLLMIAFESLGWMILGRLSFLIFRARRIPIWILPSTVIVLDHFWPRVFPWTMGHMLIGYSTLIQIADVTGALGLTWLMTATSCTVARIVLSPNMDVAKEGRLFSYRNLSAQTFAVATAAFLTAASIYGFVQNKNWQTPGTSERAMRVAALQVDSSFVGAESVLLNYSLKLAPKPDVIVWPESSLGYYSDRLDKFQDEDHVYALSREPHCSLPGLAISGTSLLACGVLYSDDAGPEGPYRNTALLIDHEQNIIGKQAKRSLLPFGEYVPGQSWFPALRCLANIDTIREPGNSCAPISTPTGVQLGAMVCYDDINPRNARETVGAGAEILTVQVNAADYNNPIALRQHCMLSLLRSVENRRFFIRCASTGLTCVIGPSGKILSRCPVQQEGIVSGIVYPISDKTIYTRFGDWPVFLSLSSFIMWFIIPQRILGKRTQMLSEDSSVTATRGASF